MVEIPPYTGIHTGGSRVSAASQNLYWFVYMCVCVCACTCVGVCVHVCACLCVRVDGWVVEGWMDACMHIFLLMIQMVLEIFLLRKIQCLTGFDVKFLFTEKNNYAIFNITKLAFKTLVSFFFLNRY